MANWRLSARREQMQAFIEGCIPVQRSPNSAWDSAMTFLAFYFQDTASAQQRLAQIAAVCSPYTPSVYHAQPEIWLDRSRRVATIEWHRSDSSIFAGNVVHGPQGDLVYDGYVTVDQADHASRAAKVASMMNVVGDRPWASNSTGGVAAFAWSPPSSDRFYCWSTQPPALGIYWARGHNFLVAGTRPLLVAQAAAEREYLQLDRGFMNIRLVSGSGLDNSTPFVGVRRVPPQHALVMGPGGAQEIDHPLPDPRDQLQDVAAASDVLAEALLSALEPLKGEHATILMSGGKDSRTVTAAAHAAGVSVSGLTYGPEGGAERVVAELMARKMEVDLRAEHQRSYADPMVAVCKSLMRTDGLVTPVPHQIRFAEQRPVGSVLLHGHGHLLRGGFASSMEDTPQKVLHVTTSPFKTGWIRTEHHARVQKYLDGWIVGRAGQDLRDLQYWAHQDLRLGAHLAPGILDYASTVPMMYPLLDERVARVSHMLPLRNKVSEAVVFSAIRKLAPSLTKIPLYGEMWRFEAKEEAAGFPGREARATKIDKNSVKSSGGMDYIGDLDRFQQYDHIVATLISDSKSYREIEPMLTDRMRGVVQSFAKNLGMPEEERKRPLSVQGSALRMLRHIFSVCMLYETNWMQPTRR